MTCDREGCTELPFSGGLCRAHWTLAGLGISRPTRKQEARTAATAARTVIAAPPRPAPTFVNRHRSGAPR